MFLVFCVIVTYLGGIYCSFSSINSDQPIELLLSRDIEYDSMKKSDPFYFSNMIQHVLSDISFKKIGLSYRFTIPFGHRFLIQATRIYPTVYLSYARNTILSEYLQMLNLTHYLQSKLSLNVKIRSSCRHFSVYDNVSRTGTDFDRAMSDWNDEIGSLSMPCSELRDPVQVTNILYNSILYSRENIPFSIRTKDSVWWSYIYDLSLFISNVSDMEDGFLVDTTDLKDMTLKTIAHRALTTNVSSSSSPVILLEPNSFWLDVEIITPFLITLNDILPHLSSSDINRILSFNTSTNIINFNESIYSSIRIPSWDVNRKIVTLYENISNTFDNTYTRTNYSQYICVNVTENATKYIVRLTSDNNSTKFNRTLCQYTPFFLSPVFRDINSQFISAVDERNFFRMDWRTYQVLSKYDKNIYDTSGFITCYNGSSPIYTNNRGLFSFINTNITNPFVSYKIYGRHKSLPSGVTSVNITVKELSKTLNVTEQDLLFPPLDTLTIAKPIDVNNTNHTSTPTIAYFSTGNISTYLIIPEKKVFSDKVTIVIISVLCFGILLLIIFMICFVYNPAFCSSVIRRASLKRQGLVNIDDDADLFSDNRSDFYIPEKKGSNNVCGQCPTCPCFRKGEESEYKPNLSTLAQNLKTGFAVVSDWVIGDLAPKKPEEGTMEILAHETLSETSDEDEKSNNEKDVDSQKNVKGTLLPHAAHIGDEKTKINHLAPQIVASIMEDNDD